MDYEEYFKKHPYLAKQVSIAAFSIVAITVPLIESRLGVEHRFYRDDLPAHNYFCESPLVVASFAQGTTSSTLSLQLINLL